MVILALFDNFSAMLNIANFTYFLKNSYIFSSNWRKNWRKMRVVEKFGVKKLG